MSKASDVAYGRRGGHIVDFVPPRALVDCEVCGAPITAADDNETAHRTCRPPEVDGQLGFDW